MVHDTVMLISFIIYKHTDCRLTVSLFLMGRGGGLVGEVGDLGVVTAAPFVGETGGGGYTGALDRTSGFLGD